MTSRLLVVYLIIGDSTFPKNRSFCFSSLFLNGSLADQRDGHQHNMATLLRLSPLLTRSPSSVTGNRRPSSVKPFLPSTFPPSLTCFPPKSSSADTYLPPLSADIPLSGDGANTYLPPLSADIPLSGDSASGGSYSGGGGGCGGGGGRSGGRYGWGAGDHHRDDDTSFPFGPLGLFLRGWRSRISADPQFPFKVLMEQLIGVTASVVGDMATRPNYGLNELDFVFSTLVVSSILKFVLMYLLAPTAVPSVGSSSTSFASSLPSYMFAPGPYSFPSRIAALGYQGATLAAIGFATGFVGTAISNGLIALRRRIDPAFEPPNKPPPTLLNAVTWAIQMGVSTNIRYQTVNGVEFLMERSLPSTVFKFTVLTLRCLNNVVGGMSLVVLARMTGSQKVVEEKAQVMGNKLEILRSVDNDFYT
ncbi:hypothetical protein AXF42_Ash013735 [Apostasia shenzhenica]|uniref:Protein RETICULATA-RELATED 3, chloroplastic n=1 Tax=Apostasia shenzhenica TaxID=1088818 RepID=A0A2I0A4R2_9ASPA|nr:hypothetical protein AXF42_Ash013735 [Apostasia shenzhenica]